MTVVVNGGSTAVVVTTLVLAATVAAVLIAELIAELIAVLGDSGRFSGHGNGSIDRRRCRMHRMRDRQDAQLTECTIYRIYD